MILGKIACISIRVITTPKSDFIQNKILQRTFTVE